MVTICQHAASTLGCTSTIFRVLGRPALRTVLVIQHAAIRNSGELDLALPETVSNLQRHILARVQCIDRCGAPGAGSLTILP
jgi:hypothetical protein